MASPAALGRCLITHSATTTARRFVGFRFLHASASAPARTTTPLAAGTDDLTMPLVTTVPATGPDPSVVPTLVSAPVPLASKASGDAQDGDRAEHSSVAAWPYGHESAVSTRRSLADGPAPKVVATGLICTHARSFAAATRPGYGSHFCIDLHVDRHTFPLASPKRLTHFSPHPTTGRRPASKWARTQLEPTKLNNPPIKPLDIDEIVKLISELDPNSKELEKLTTALLEKLCSEEKGEPKSSDLEQNLILQRQKVSIQLLSFLADQAKEKPSWGTFMLFGKKVNLASVVASVAALIGLF